MTFGLPHNLAPRLIYKSFTRAAHVVAYVLLAGNAVILVAYQVWSPEATLWPAALALIPMAGLLIILDRRRTTGWAFLYLAVGGLTVFFITWSVASQFDLQQSADLLGYHYVKSALVLIGGVGVGRRRVLLWGTAAYAVAETAAAVALAAAGATWTFDAVTALAFFGMVLLVVLSGSEGLRGQPVESRLRRAARDEVAGAVVYRIQQRASAILHDTVLNHLSTLSHTVDGPLPADQRRFLERDLGLVRGVTLGESLITAAVSSSDEERWNAHPIHEAIRGARSQGLDVDITGDPEAALEVQPHVAKVIALALTQSLVNVMKHSGVTEVEVSLHSTGAEVMVMVIDGGRGFDLAEVGSDRLGLRGSIRGRIESIGGSVQIWSGLGKGTSIVMNVPLEVAPAAESSAKIVGSHDTDAADDGVSTLADRAP